MVDFLIKKIPLPIPRPQIEDIFVDPRIFNRDIPLPDIYSYSQSWIDWVIERKEEMKEMLVQFYGQIEKLPKETSSFDTIELIYSVAILSLLAGGAISIGYLFYLGISKLISLTKK